VAEAEELKAKESLNMIAGLSLANTAAAATRDDEDYLDDDHEPRRRKKNILRARHVGEDELWDGD